MTLLYARVGGPPDNWYEYKVRDRITRAEIPRVREVDVREGWCKVIKTDENGEYILSGDSVEEEIIYGDFVIERRKLSDT